MQLEIKELAGHDFDAPGDAGHAHIVAAAGANDAGNMGAVPVIIHGIAGAGDGINAMDIVDVAVVVVIDAVAGNFARIVPHVRHQIFVGVAHARIHHRDQHVRSRALKLPSVRRMNICASRPTLLAPIE